MKQHLRTIRWGCLLLASLALPVNSWAYVEWKPASITGGEAFPIQGGVAASAAYLATKIYHCPASPEPTPAPGPVPPANASPAPDVAWRATYCDPAPGNPPDPQIAVSSQHVAVTFEDAMAWYSKNGVEQGQLKNFDLFAPLLATLAAGAGRASDSNDCYTNKLFPSCARTQSDFRILFDPFRHRFWAIDGAGIYNAPYTCDSAGTCGRDPTKIRGIIMLAVSQTEDPKDGWYLYWWDAVAHWGQPKDTVFQPGDGADYPCIGIDSLGFYESNIVADRNGVNKYQHVVLIPAYDNRLIGGHTVTGRHYFDLQDPGGTTTAVIQPVIHHGWGGNTYFVSRYGNDEAIVWSAANPFEGGLKYAEFTLNAFQTPVDAPEPNGTSPIDMTNIRQEVPTEVLKAVYRDGEIAFVTVDAKAWFTYGEHLTSIRLVRLWVLGGDPAIAKAIDIDTLFGRNGWDDSPEARVYYGWPAVEMNRDFNMAVVYTRSGTGVYPEMRYSAYFNNESAIRPERPLHPGSATYLPTGCFQKGQLRACRWADTGGVAVDPNDDTSIWLAHQYADNSPRGWDLWVARVLAPVFVGPVHPLQ